MVFKTEVFKPKSQDFLLQLACLAFVFVVLAILGLLLSYDSGALANMDNNASSSAAVAGTEASSSNQITVPKTRKLDPTKSFVEDEIVVKFKSEVDDAGKKQIISTSNSQIKKEEKFLGFKVLRVDPQKRDKILEDLKRNPKVEYAHLNHVIRPGLIPDDPSFPQQWNLAKIQAPSAWNFHVGDANVVTAVIDSGINYNLPELRWTVDGGRIIKGKNVLTGNLDPLDDYGHGTEVASILGAATGNGIDIAGVDWRAYVMAVKTNGSDGSGTTADAADGITSAVNYTSHLKVINISLWGGQDDQVLREAVNYALGRGVLVVGIAGYGDVPEQSNCFVGYPGAYAGVIAVVASDQNDNHASGCTQGKEDNLLMAAPGVGIPAEGIDGKVKAVYGTSFAAPQVAGAASILFSCSAPSPSLESVRQALISSAFKPSGGDNLLGNGRLDLYRALQNLSGCLPPFLPNGDVDCNGVVDSVDAMHILKYVAGLEPGGNNCGAGMVFLPNAYVDGNGVVDSTDALYVLQIISGIRSAQTQALIPPAVDSDGDGMTDQEEAQYSCLNPRVADANLDFDGDKLTNIQEIALGTNPCAADTDGDGYSDYTEFYLGTKPTVKCGTDAWPPDINNDGQAALADVLSFIPFFNLSVGNDPVKRRRDLNHDGMVALADVLTFIPVFNKSCSSL